MKGHGRTTRRTHIAILLALLLTTAGCVSSGTPGDAGITAREPDNDGTAEPAELHHAIEDQDLTVTRLTHDDGTLHVTYESTATSPGQRHAEMDTLAAVYADYVDHGGPGDQLVVTYEGPGDDEHGEFQIDREWATAYTAGDLSAREFLNRIQETLTQGDPPTTEG